MSSCIVSTRVLRSSRVNRVKQVWECSLISFPAPLLQICIYLCEHQHTPNSTGTGWSAWGTSVNCPMWRTAGQHVCSTLSVELCVCIVCTAALLKQFIHIFASLLEGFTQFETEINEDCRRRQEELIQWTIDQILCLHLAEPLTVGYIM